QVIALPVDRQKDLVQVPFVAWLGASTLQLIRVILPKLQTPLANGFMGDVDPAFEQGLLHVAVTQREAIVEPDPMTDNLAWKAVIFVALGGSGWRHVGCLSSDWLGPREGMAVGIMSWAGEDGQQLDNAIYGTLHTQNDLQRCQRAAGRLPGERGCRHGRGECRHSGCSRAHRDCLGDARHAEAQDRDVSHTIGPFSRQTTTMTPSPPLSTPDRPLSATRLAQYATVRGRC